MNLQKQKIDKYSIKDKEQYLTIEAGIDQLNNDCLRHIFQYLPIVDRVRLERVCKRWHMISQESWHDFKELRFENDCWGFSKFNEIEKINCRILKKILYRCGQFLTDIEFSDCNKRLGPNVLNVVAKLCPNIQSVCAADLQVSPWSIRALADSCTKIISFSIGDCTDECDSELSILFKNNKELKMFCIYSNFEVTGKCLLKLNSEYIETIIFENCPSISLKYFNVVKNFSNLKVLMIEHFHDSNNETMENISMCSKSLKFITLALCPFYSNTLCQIAMLTNLESLDLSSNLSVDDDVLTAIGANCKLLRKVDISYCNSVTNIGLLNIVSLPNLKSLYIVDLDNITDQVFIGMPNLKQMDCSFCSNIRDAGLAKLIETSENIEHLYLSYCRNISNELLEAAIRATKKRSNNVILKMYVSNTDIQLSKMSDTSPYLQVIPLIVVSFTK